MSAPLSLTQIAGLVAIAETGSISAAARRLGLTQPAASQQIRNLERRLGLALTERAGGRTHLSAAAEALLAPARAALAAAAEMEALAGRHRVQGLGRLRLGTGATACIHLLPPVLAQLRASAPAIEIVITTGDTPDILAALQAGTLDAGFVTLPGAASLPRGGPWRGLSLGLWRADPMCALLPAAWPAAAPLSPAALAAGKLILYEPAGLVRALIDAWFATSGIRAQPAMTLGNAEAIKMLVAGGLGATVLPCSALGRAPAGTRVVALDPPLGRRLGLVMRVDKRRDRGLRALIAAMAAMPEATDSTAGG